MALPQLLYFDSLESVNTDDIEGDAIVLVGTDSPDKASVHFVRNHQWFKPKRQRKPSVITVNKEELLDVLQRKKSARKNQLIRKLGFENNFPYIYTGIYLPAAEPIIEIRDKDIEDVSLLDNLHPYMHEYLKYKDESNRNLIPFLQKIESDPEAKKYCEFYLQPREQIYKKTSLHNLIDVLRKRIQMEFITYDEFQKKAKKIASRFINSKWTKRKKDIFEDFENFCNANCNKDLNNLNYLPRNVLVERWSNKYMQEHPGENPFVILSQHRRKGFFSMFHTGMTDSVKLFHAFLEGEIISESLRTIMQGYIPGNLMPKKIKNKKPGSSSEI